MCCNRWKVIGLGALLLGAAILIVAIFPAGFVLFFIAFLLILCGIGLIKRRW